VDIMAIDPVSATQAPPTASSSAEPSAATSASSALEGLTERARREAEILDRELAEIDMLVAQARTEAQRHEQKRAQTAERASASQDAQAWAALVPLTRRAAVMEAQVDVLEGKRKALARFREALGGYLDGMSSAGSAVASLAGSDQDLPGDGATMTPAMSRVVLGAQEDLRREIAREMHDGPAQSLTNIVLQAQIVERLVMRDQHQAGIELRSLIAMVQQTLEATKTFIFDVRPMVLDDLGLVPTMRRAARDRGRRAKVPVDFESMGTDRRLPMDIESAVFRILDEALAGYLAQSPKRCMIRLDWASEALEASIVAERDVVLPPDDVLPAPEAKGKDKNKAELPPALAQMVEARKADREAAIQAAYTDAIVTLPPTVRREIQGRAGAIDGFVTFGDDGSVHVAVPLRPGSEG
jgi:two-component system, NarL family, sensor histidine kinase DegS